MRHIARIHYKQGGTFTFAQVDLQDLWSAIADLEAYRRGTEDPIVKVEILDD